MYSFRQWVFPICDGPTRRTIAFLVIAKLQSELTFVQMLFSIKRSDFIFARSASSSRYELICETTLSSAPSYLPAKSRDSVAPEYSTRAPVWSNE